MTISNSKSNKRIKRIIPSLTAAAAGLIILVGLPVYRYNKSEMPVVLLNGTEITKDVVIPSSEESSISTAAIRSMPQFSTSVEIELNRETELTVSKGIMTAYDRQTGEQLISGDKFTAEGNIEVSWTVEIPTSTDTYYMTLDDGRKSYEITLTYNSTLSEWTIGCLN